MRVWPGLLGDGSCVPRRLESYGVRSGRWSGSSNGGGGSLVFPLFSENDVSPLVKRKKGDIGIDDVN